MKKLFALLALIVVTVTVHAAPGGGGGGVTTPWFQTQWTSSGQWVPVNALPTGGLAKFTFPTYTYRASGRTMASFLTTTLTNFIGNHTGKTVSATFTIEVVSGDPVFMFGGQLNKNGTGPGWNTGSFPPSCRIFFSTNAATYSNGVADLNQHGYWWSNPVYVEIDALTGTATITESLATVNWSNAQGILAADAWSAFVTATGNVRQIGVSFCGGSFFDIGNGVLEGTGTATFTLNSFSVQ